MNQKMNHKTVKKCIAKSNAKVQSANESKNELSIEELLLLCRPVTIRLPKLKILESFAVKTVTGKLFERRNKKIVLQ